MHENAMPDPAVLDQIPGLRKEEAPQPPSESSIGKMGLPRPMGVAHVPSPRQNVVLLADAPLLRLATGKFPVTPPLPVPARLMAGISVPASARNAGAPAVAKSAWVVVVSAPMVEVA